MKLFLSVVLCSAASLAAAAPGTSDQQKLQGTWNVVAGNEGGKTVTPGKVKGTKMVIARDKMTVFEKDKKREMTFALDAAKTPPTIDMTFTEGKRKGEISRGIYMLDGDTLKIAFTMPGTERPTTFTPKQGSKEMLFVLKRAQP